MSDPRGEAFERLLAIVRGETPTRHIGAIVSAARAILEETRTDASETLLQILDGDRTKYRAWLEAELAKLDAEDRAGANA